MKSQKYCLSTNFISQISIPPECFLENIQGTVQRKIDYLYWKRSIKTTHELGGKGSGLSKCAVSAPIWTWPCQLSTSPHFSLKPPLPSKTADSAYLSEPSAHPLIPVWLLHSAVHDIMPQICPECDEVARNWLGT